MIRLLLLALVVGMGVLFVRDSRAKAEYDRQMAACIKWASANVEGVDPRAWCEP